MLNKEIELISNTDNIYNLAEGGIGGNYSKNWTLEEKLKYSQKMSIITKNRINKIGTFNNNPFLNKTNEERLELIKKWSDCKKGLKNNNAKYPSKIAQIKDGKIIKIWNNVYEASEIGGFRVLYMVKCASNKYSSFKTHKGFKWEFINNDSI